MKTLKIIVNSNDFKKLSSSEIVKIMNKCKYYAIVSDDDDSDRYIINRNFKKNKIFKPC